MLSNEPVHGWKIPRALLEEYPLEIGVALVMIPTGATLILPPYPRGDDNWVWEAFAVVLGVAMVISAAVLAIGLTQWVRTLHAGVEQAGFWMGAGVVATNIYMEAVTDGSSLSGYFLHSFIIIAFLTRAMGIQRKSRSMRTNLEVFHELREEVDKHDPRNHRGR